MNSRQAFHFKLYINLPVQTPVPSFVYPELHKQVPAPLSQAALATQLPSVLAQVVAELSALTGIKNVWCLQMRNNLH